MKRVAAPSRAAGVFFEDDSLIYLGQLNGKPPLHVLFSMRTFHLVRQLEVNGTTARTAHLAIVLEIGRSALAAGELVPVEELEGRHRASREAGRLSPQSEVT